MRSHKMSTTMTNQPAGISEISTIGTVVWDKTSHRRYASSRCLRWLWSDQGDINPKAHGNSQSPPREISGKLVRRDLVSPAAKTGSDKLNISPDDMPCRACQTWGVECDLRRPRCSHCLHEQILCFYIAPLRLRIGRPKEQAYERLTGRPYIVDKKIQLCGL
jgi:hypothetical protein